MLKTREEVSSPSQLTGTVSRGSLTTPFTQIWLMRGDERESKTGRCFNDMVVDKTVESEKGFLYCFKRAKLREWEREKERADGRNGTTQPKSSLTPVPLLAGSLLDLAISVGDRLVISTVDGPFPPFFTWSFSSSTIVDLSR